MAGFFDDLASSVRNTTAKPVKKAAPKRRAPAKKKPRATTASKPSVGLLGNAAAAVQGAVSGTARGAAQGKTPAQTARNVERDVAASRRTEAIRSYLDAPRAERSKQAAAAERRVATGKASARDKLIVETHARRTKNDDGRSPAAVRAANAEHDRAVAAERARDAVTAAIDRLGKQRLTVSTKDDSKSLIGKLVDDIKSAPSDLVSGTKANAKTGANAAADVGIAAADAVTAASKLRAPGTSDGLKGTKAGIDPGGAAKSLALPVKVAANVTKVSADDPSQIPRAVKDIASMVKDLPAGVVQSVSDPKGALAATGKDLKRRYGPLIEGHDAEFRERLKKEGIAPEIVDTLGLVSGESTGAARAVSGVAKATAKTTKAGSRVNRAAGRVERFVNEPRPDLVKSTNVAKPQRKSSGLIGLAAQRAVDKRREVRVQREATEAAALRGKLPAAANRRQQRSVARLARKVEQEGAGQGIRGPVPQGGQVAPVRAAARSRAVRTSVARVASIGFRRLDRLQNELTRDAEQRFRALRPVEQRAAVHALEGTININNAEASVAAIDKRIKAIQAERTVLRRDQPKDWENKYLPLVGKRGSDELVQLADLRAALVENPDKVLTDRLREFVAGEQERRPKVDRVAGDSLRPSTILARRFAPAGELTGTRLAYVPRRNALDRLEAMTPEVALRKIGAELKVARTKRVEGRTTRRALELAAEARAVQQFAKGRPLNKRVPADVLDRARTVEAERFAEVTKKAAFDQGLGTIDPVVVKHRKRNLGGAGARAVGGSEKGPVAAAKKTDMKLFRAGVRDTSDRAYALGMQESAKRSVQWRMVDELVQDHVPAWARGKDGNGLTLTELELRPETRTLDPNDWVAWRAGRREVRDGDEFESDGDAEDPAQRDPIGDAQTAPLKDVTNVKWATDGNKFWLVPVEAFNEMKRGHGGAESVSRVGSRVTGLQSQAILGSNPAYGIRQVLQTMPLTTVAVGGRVFDRAFWNNLRTYRRAAKLNPEQYNDMLDVIGVRSKSADAVRSVKRGDQMDVKRFEGALQHTWGGLFGAAAKDYFVSPRRSPGGAGTASQGARTAAKTALTPFRLVRDGNMMLDAWQDRFARTLALAAQDAKMAKGDAARFGETVAAATADQAKRTGPLAAALDLPADELAKLARTPEFRRMAEEAADGVTKWLGDYANYTQREQKIGRAFVPFYGFARHSTRLLVYTLPLEHPFTFAVVLSQSGIQQREKERLLREYMRKVGREGDIPDMLDGLVLTANGGGTLETVDVRWLNPLTGPVFEALSSDPATATTGVATPLVKGILEASFETNAFTKRPLSNAQGQGGPANKLSGLDKARVVTNRVLSSMFPFRAFNDIQNGEKGKLTDTSLPLPGLAQPYPYKEGEAKDKNDKKISEARAQGTLERLLDSVGPFRKKPATSLLNSAEYAAETAGKNKKKPKKPAASGGSFGGGSFGGSGGFGGGGGF